MGSLRIEARYGDLKFAFHFTFTCFLLDVLNECFALFVNRFTQITFVHMDLIEYSVASFTL